MALALPGCSADEPLSPRDAAGAGPAANAGVDAGPEPGESGIFVGVTAAHNAVRAAVAATPPLPELRWSSDLAATASEWAEELSGSCGTLRHRQPNRYGENIAARASTRVAAPFSAAEVVDSWAAEVACWQFGSIQGTERCDTACVADLNSTGCGHYTQLVWRNTERVGCGHATCERAGYTHEIWVCNYDPPGNFIGERPY